MFPSSGHHGFYNPNNYPYQNGDTAQIGHYGFYNPNNYPYQNGDTAQIGYYGFYNPNNYPYQNGHIAQTGHYPLVIEGYNDSPLDQARTQFSLARFREALTYDNLINTRLYNNWSEGRISNKDVSSTLAYNGWYDAWTNKAYAAWYLEQTSDGRFRPNEFNISGILDGNISQELLTLAGSIEDRRVRYIRMSELLGARNLQPIRFAEYFKHDTRIDKNYAHYGAPGRSTLLYTLLEGKVDQDTCAKFIQDMNAAKHSYQRADLVKDLFEKTHKGLTSVDIDNDLASVIHESQKNIRSWDKDYTPTPNTPQKWPLPNLPPFSE